MNDPRMSFVQTDVERQEPLQVVRAAGPATEVDTITVDGQVAVDVGAWDEDVHALASFAERAEQAVVFTPEQQSRALTLDRSEKRMFLYAFCTTGTIAGAARLLVDAAGDSLPAANASSHARWMRTDTTYKRLFEEAEEMVTAAWDEMFQRWAAEGIEERSYDGNGNLRRRKVRQDTSLIQRVAAARLAKYRHQDKAGGVTVNINVERVEE